MLELKNISKKYGQKLALNDINISFGKGIYGLLGPNGAGKTTMMNIITDILEPSEGIVLYDDEPIKKMNEKYRMKIAYLPQRVGYYPDFTARKTLEYFGKLRGVDKSKINERIKYALDAVNLTDVEKNKVGTFSGGMKQRLGIAITLISNPEILIFDEPTVGLDPKERVKFRNIVSGLAKEKTIILSTHIVSDIENIADYIVLLKEGKIVGKGTKNEILNLAENKTDEATLEGVYMHFYEEEPDNE